MQYSQPVIINDDLKEFSSRRKLPIDMIVLHYVSNPKKPQPFSVASIIDTFRGYRVSSNFLISRDGLTIQLIDPERKAWHAGLARYLGSSKVNDRAIGIELAGNDDEEFMEAQYEALIVLSADLCVEFGIPVKNIKGHQIVSDRTVRPDPKPDPGRMFDWINYGHRLMIELEDRE